MISGEDTLTVDRKYRDPWTGRLPTRFVILTNELPRLTDSSGALASRFNILVLTKSFYGTENPSLTDELLKEAPGILNWALEGIDRLTARGYFVNAESGKDAIQQVEDLSSPIGAFVRDVCIIAPEARVRVDELWTAWKAWCHEDNRHAGTKEVFGRDLRAAVPTLKRTKVRGVGERHPVYQGIGLRAGNGEPDPGPTGPRHSSAGPGGPSGPGSASMNSAGTDWEEL